jgi:formiminoglutamase
MDLKIFFSPIDESIYSGIKEHNTFYKNIKVNGEKMPDYKEADIVLIGLQEDRGTFNNKGVALAADEIRRKLYRLKRGSGNYKVVDLGNLRNGMTLEETYLRIKEVCNILIESNILPVILGGSHDMGYAQYLAYESMEKLVSVLNVDGFFDIDDEEGMSPSQKHVHKILMHEPNYLINYSHLAYQSYLVDKNAVALLEKLYFETYRLGHIRQNLAEIEPVIREADMLSFDITAIKSSDAPGNANAQPFGLTGEEACQICWYAGLNEKLSSAGFYEYNPVEDDNKKKTAAVTATMIWYFIEGYYHRKNEKGFKTNDYLKYVVYRDTDPFSLTFYKSKLSEKWWMEVSYPNNGNKYERNAIVPCSYSDYEMAIKGELPDRWITAHAKLI